MLSVISCMMYEFLRMFRSSGQGIRSNKASGAQKGRLSDLRLADVARYSIIGRSSD